MILYQVKHFRRQDWSDSPPEAEWTFPSRIFEKGPTKNCFHLKYRCVFVECMSMMKLFIQVYISFLIDG